MSFTYRITIPPTVITAAGVLAQFTAPSGPGSWRLAGFRLNQTGKNISELCRLSFTQLTGLANGGTVVAGTIISGGSTGVTLQATVPTFTDQTGVLPTVIDEYFGWNVINGEYQHTPVPDARPRLTPATPYGLYLHTAPSTGGFTLSGVILLEYTP